MMMLIMNIHITIILVTLIQLIIIPATIMLLIMMIVLIHTLMTITQLLIITTTLIIQITIRQL